MHATLTIIHYAILAMHLLGLAIFLMWMLVGVGVASTLECRLQPMAFEVHLRVAVLGGLLGDFHQPWHSWPSPCWVQSIGVPPSVRGASPFPDWRGRSRRWHSPSLAGGSCWSRWPSLALSAGCYSSLASFSACALASTPTHCRSSRRASRLLPTGLGAGVFGDFHHFGIGRCECWRSCGGPTGRRGTSYARAPIAYASWHFDVDLVHPGDEAVHLVIGMDCDAPHAFGVGAHSVWTYTPRSSHSCS